MAGQPRRPVDKAMRNDRPAKQTVRQLWLTEVRAAAQRYVDDDVPLYITLGGAAGNDIKMLLDDGLVELTETGAIAEKDYKRVVAVESSNSAILELQSRYPGLWIKEAPFENLLRGQGRLTWPTGEDRVVCRARIVNLDLNAPLTAFIQDGVTFPALVWIEKLAVLHAEPPLKEWTLCLTLHGELNWEHEVNEWARALLNDNVLREPQFGAYLTQLLGADLVASMRKGDTAELVALPRVEQQKIIMVLVPKLIAMPAHLRGWRLTTDVNFRYGGDAAHAPMVTWILHFAPDEGLGAEPNQLYNDALVGIFKRCGVITANGEIEEGLE